MAYLLCFPASDMRSELSFERAPLHPYHPYFSGLLCLCGSGCPLNLDKWPGKSEPSPPENIYGLWPSTFAASDQGNAKGEIAYFAQGLEARQNCVGHSIPLSNWQLISQLPERNLAKNTTRSRNCKGRQFRVN